MIKTMLVEDEPPILRNIKNSIEALDPDFRVVACADDGEEAISLLRTVKPDVVFTDIRMPVVNGLDLLSHIQANYPGTVTVIISGYQEFDYARRALRFGASEYLLKPISPASLADLLVQIKERLLEKKNNQAEQYLFDLVHSSSPVSAHSVELKPYYPYYLIMLLNAGAFSIFSMDCLNPALEFWTEIDLADVTAELLAREGIEGKAWAFNGKSSVEKLVLFGLHQSTEQTADRLADLLASALPPSRYPVTIALSRFLTDVRDIGFVSQQLRSLINKKIILGVPQIISSYGSLSMEAHRPEELPTIDSLVKNRFIHHAQHKNLSAIRKDLETLFNQWEESRYPQIWVEKLLKQLIMLCQNELSFSSQYDAASIELEINEAISNSSSYKELFRHIWYVFEQIFSEKRKQKLTEESLYALMKSVEHFLLNNYTNTIDNRMLSDNFNLAASYLSKLFRQYKGISPSEFITRLRLEKAQQLIQTEADMMIKDIAEIVGYNDPLYFSRIFKKEFGLSPSEYKSAHQE
ncbi:response regulator [Paenibacillaceae bacterium WGS1546]|uniref:response regulator n=1 Tax=Cohnella sp. WGS1546 TaxID=3366810 RepID=UPI00372D308D